MFRILEMRIKNGRVMENPYTTDCQIKSNSFDFRLYYMYVYMQIWRSSHDKSEKKENVLVPNFVLCSICHNNKLIEFVLINV